MSLMPFIRAVQGTGRDTAEAKPSPELPTVEPEAEERDEGRGSVDRGVGLELVSLGRNGEVCRNGGRRQPSRSRYRPKWERRSEGGARRRVSVIVPPPVPFPLIRVVAALLMLASPVFFPFPVTFVGPKSLHWPYVDGFRF